MSYNQLKFPGGLYSPFPIKCSYISYKTVLITDNHFMFGNEYNVNKATTVEPAYSRRLEGRNSFPFIWFSRLINRCKYYYSGSLVGRT